MGESRLQDKIRKLQPNYKLIMALGVTGLALAGITTTYMLNRGVAKQEATEIVKPEAIKVVSALGRIEPQGQIIKLAPTPDLGGAKIAQLLVKEGDRITTGQTIALLDNYGRNQAQVELARQEIKIAEAERAIIQAGEKQGDINAQAANLQRAKAQLEGEIVANQAEIKRLQAQLISEKAEKQAIIESRTAELTNAKREFQRYRQLAQEGVISESQLDSRRLTQDLAQKALNQAQASYNLTLDTLQQEINQAQAIARQNKNTLQQQVSAETATLNSVSEVREVDLIKAQAQVDRAIATLRQAEEDLKLSSVIAPMDGQIIKINSYPGEVVDDEGVVEFAQTNKMMVVAEVYESDIAKVRVGQTATISSETGAFNGEITGKVSQIGLKIGKQNILNTDPAADVDSRVVEVKIYLDPPNSDRVAYLTNSKAIIKINL